MFLSPTTPIFQRKELPLTNIVMTLERVLKMALLNIKNTKVLIEHNIF